MKGRYAPVLVLLPIFLLVLYVYWLVFFQNVIMSQSVEQIPFGSQIRLESDIYQTAGLAIFHFYDPSCLVAKDNIEHLKLLVEQCTGREASWYIVSNETVDKGALRNKLGFQPTLVEDLEGELASALGVITTPAMVILDDNKLYFRGTYLKNGAFCGAEDITSSDAGIALRSSMKGNPLPLYLKDIKSYVGCAL